MDYVIEETGNDLSMVHLEPLRDVSNMNHSPSGERYRKLVSQAKRQSAEGHAKQALNTLLQAVKINNNEKILKKIEKLKAFIKMYDQSSEEEEEESGMVHVGKGFYLHGDLYSKLYPHQKEGVIWFWRLHRKGQGGILGDDMGLGKTIQVVSFLSGLFDTDQVKSVMIILPVALIMNWEREFEKWAPGIRVETFYTESKHQRQRKLDKVQHRGGVLLISYGLVVTNCDNLKTQNCRPFTWDYVILDEGHKIKNPTKTTKAVHAVAAHHRFILSGTPVQNNLKELWSLFDFVCQGTLLGTRQTFCSMYENPITRARERCGTASEKRLGNEMAESLRRLIAPHFLRRTKSDVKRAKQEIGNNKDAEDEDGKGGAEMPTLTRKNDLIVWMHLSQPQIQIYQEFLSLDRVKELLMTTRSPLVELTILKKICDHPRLLSTLACQQLGLAGDTDMTDADESRQKECAANLVNQIPDNVLMEESGKLQFLMGLLENLRSEGHRTLVFSQSRKMLDIIQKLLRSRGIKFLRLDGTIRKLEEREKLINSFQKNNLYSVFLLTTQVGGVGLTLTAADRVVVFDPHWNPATDNQAVDRVYRIGQTRSVVIYRLITCGSVEEKIYRRQVFKDSITRQTTGDSKNPYRYFTRQQMHELFVLDDPQVSTTQQQLEELHTGHRITDQTLDDHIAYLYSLGIFGLSDHDLMFSQEAVQETAESHANESTYIHETVQKAQTLVADECQLTRQIKEHHQNEDDGQRNQQSTGQYRDRFSLMNQLSRMKGVDVPEPPPRTRAPPTAAPAPAAAPAHRPYGRDIDEVDMVDLDLDSKEITEEDLNRTMESLTLKDYKTGHNDTQEMIQVDEVIDLTDDSYISTDSSNQQSDPQNHSTNERRQPHASPKMEYIDLTEDQEEANASIQKMYHHSNVDSIPSKRLSVEDQWSSNNLPEANNEQNSSKLSHLDLNLPEGICEIISSSNSEVKEPSPYGFIRPSDINITRSPVCNLLGSNKTLSAQNSPATSRDYIVPDSDVSDMFQDSIVSEAGVEVSCVVEESDEEDYTSMGTSDSVSQDDEIVNDSLAEMDTSYQSIDAPESGLDDDQVSNRKSGSQKSSPKHDLPHHHGQKTSDTLKQNVESLEESIMETEEEADVESATEEEILKEEEIEGRMEENEEDLTEDVESATEEAVLKEKEIEGRMEENEEDLTEDEGDGGSATEEEEVLEEDGVAIRIEEKEEDLTEGEGDDVGDETLSDEEDEENSIDEFINDDDEEEEDVSGSDESDDDDDSGEEEEEDEDNSNEADDPMYLQLVKEGSNQENGGNMKRALKCYLKALEIESKDRSLQMHAYKLARTIKKQQNQL